MALATASCGGDSRDIPCLAGDFLATEIVDLTIKNGDVPIKNDDLPIKNGDFPIKNADFPVRSVSSLCLSQSFVGEGTHRWRTQP